MFDWDPASLGLTTKLPKLKYNEAGRGEEGVEGAIMQCQTGEDCCRDESGADWYERLSLPSVSSSRHHLINLHFTMSAVKKCLTSNSPGEFPFLWSWYFTCVWGRDQWEGGRWEIGWAGAALRFTRVTLPIHYNINTRERGAVETGEPALTIHNAQTLSAAGRERSSVSSNDQQSVPWWYLCKHLSLLSLPSHSDN